MSPGKSVQKAIDETAAANRARRLERQSMLAVLTGREETDVLGFIKWLQDDQWAQQAAAEADGDEGEARRAEATVLRLKLLREMVQDAIIDTGVGVVEAVVTSITEARAAKKGGAA